MALRIDSSPMNAHLHRIAVMIGLVLAMTAALWWLGSTRLALDGARDPVRPAADVLYALFVVRAMALPLLSLRIGALRGWPSALVTGLGVVVPAWPLVLLAWSASTTTFWSVVRAEALLLAAGIALALIGVGLRRCLHSSELAIMVATGLGVVLAAAVWLHRSALIMLMA